MLAVTGCSGYARNRERPMHRQLKQGMKRQPMQAAEAKAESDDTVYELKTILPRQSRR